MTEYHGSWQRYGEGRVKVFIQFSGTFIILAFIDAQKTVTAILKYQTVNLTHLKIGLSSLFRSSNGKDALLIRVLWLAFNRAGFKSPTEHQKMWTMIEMISRESCPHEKPPS